MSAEAECPATPPECPRDATPERIKLSPSRRGAASPASADDTGRASPDSACPICLGKLENKAFTDGCMHKFCFTCILEWSKVRAVCPLCKQSFTSIIHNVRSELDYDRYRLPPPPAEPTYVYRPGFESQPRWLRRHQYRIRSLMLPMLWPLPDRHNYHLPSVARPPPAHWRSRITSSDRRQLYATGMWARPTADELTGRYRETGPDFYRNNPACTHRLVPWLNRELNAVLDSSVHLSYVLEHVMELITRLHILSPQFKAQLRPYLGGWTEHFVHELYMYARSPYDMVGYDLHVQYDEGRPETPPAEQTISSGSDSEVATASNQQQEQDNDSDVRVITPPTAAPISVVDSPASPEPGPSGLQSALDRVRAFLETVTGAVAGASSESEVSEGEVQVLDVLPPIHERPAPLVLLSSDPEAEDPPAAGQAPPETPATSRQERSSKHRRSRHREKRAAKGGRKHASQGETTDRRSQSSDKKRSSRSQSSEKRSSKGKKSGRHASKHRSKSRSEEKTSGESRVRGDSTTPDGSRTADMADRRKDSAGKSKSRDKDGDDRRKRKREHKRSKTRGAASSSRGHKRARLDSSSGAEETFLAQPSTSRGVPADLSSDDSLPIQQDRRRRYSRILPPPVLSSSSDTSGHVSADSDSSGLTWRPAARMRSAVCRPRRTPAVCPSSSDSD